MLMLVVVLSALARDAKPIMACWLGSHVKCSSASPVATLVESAFDWLQVLPEHTFERPPVAALYATQFVLVQMTGSETAAAASSVQIKARFMVQYDVTFFTKCRGGLVVLVPPTTRFQFKLSIR